MNKHTNNEGWEDNRYKKLRITRKSFFYCGCDMDATSKGEKCDACKRKNGRRKLKKY